MSMKPVEIKAWMGDGTEYVVRYYKEADFDAKERELAACRAENERLIDAQSREGRHALRVENERLRAAIERKDGLLADCDTMLVGYSHLRATISEALGLGDESQDIVALIDRLRENAALKEPT